MLASLKSFIKPVGAFVSKNSPIILTGMAVVGVVITTALAISATPKAMMLIEEEMDNRVEKYLKDNPEKDRYDVMDDYNSVTFLDMVKISWKCYIPTATFGIATISCILGASKIQFRRYAALSTMYSLTDAAFKEFKTKVSEKIGPNKESKIVDEISRDVIRTNPSSSNEIIVTGRGEMLCYDKLFGRYFISDIEKIRKAVNDVNHQLIYNQAFITLNDLYYELGLSPIDLGELMGWSLDDKGPLEVYFSTQLSDKNEPCIVLNYEVQPKFLQ